MRAGQGRWTQILDGRGVWWAWYLHISIHGYNYKESNVKMCPCVLGSWTRTLSINSALSHMVLHYLCWWDSSISRGKQSSLSATFTWLCPHMKFKHLATFQHWYSLCWEMYQRNPTVVKPCAMCSITPCTIEFNSKVMWFFYRIRTRTRLTCQRSRGPRLSMAP